MRGRLKLGQLLLNKGLISPEQLAAALGEQERWGRRLGMTLVRMDFVDEEALIRVLASQLRLPVARIRGKRVNPEVLELVPVDLAEKYRCLPLFLREEGGGKTLSLAMEDPSDLQALDELSFRIGEKLRPVLVAPTELEDALQRHYHAAALMGPADALPPVPVSRARPPDAQDAETAPDLLPLDPLVGDGTALDPNVAPVFETPSVPEPSQGLEPRVILRALAQLLVEKGVLTRDELAERLRSIASQERRGG